MLEFEVTSKETLRAALLAAGQSTYAQARENPVVIRWERAVYKFPNGLHYTRAEKLAASVRRGCK